MAIMLGNHIQSFNACRSAKLFPHDGSTTSATFQPAIGGQRSDRSLHNGPGTMKHLRQLIPGRNRLTCHVFASFDGIQQIFFDQSSFGLHKNLIFFIVKDNTIIHNFN